MFADTPVYLTHTSLRDDLGAIGTVPFRYLMFNLPGKIQVGILADITTRLDLVFKALQNPQVPQMFLIKPSVAEMETPPYCVRWTFTNSIESSLREFTVNKTSSFINLLILILHCTENSLNKVQLL